MPTSLANRVRGEQVPHGENQLRLLEVIVDEELQRPLWRARCLRTGNLITIALDGFVQPPKPVASSQTAQSMTPMEALAERRRQRSSRLWWFILASLLLAGFAMFYQDTIVAWGRALQQLLETGHLSTPSS